MMKSFDFQKKQLKKSRNLTLKGEIILLAIR